MTDLAHLPYELLCLIVGNLKEQHDLFHCALVNRQFNTMINPILWLAPKTKNRAQPFLSDLAFSILSSLLVTPPSSLLLGSHIRTLHFRKGDAAQRITAVVRFTPLLQDLALDSIDMHDDSIETIARVCPQINKVTLENLDKITDRAIIHLGDHCPHLRDLTLHSMDGLSAQCLVNMDRLERLDLENCYSLKDTATATLIAGFHQLTHLTTPPHIKPEFMRRLLSHNNTSVPRLVSFNMSSSPHVPLDTHLLTSFIQTYPLLQTLKLGQHLDPTWTTTLVHGLPLLTHLQLRLLTAHPVSFPSFASSRLLSLHIIGYDLSAFFSIHLSLPALEYLGLSFCQGLDTLELRRFIKRSLHLNTVTVKQSGLNRVFPEIIQRHGYPDQLDTRAIRSSP